jgi:hypothetical protein
MRLIEVFARRAPPAQMAIPPVDAKKSAALGRSGLTPGQARARPCPSVPGPYRVRAEPVPMPVPMPVHGVVQVSHAGDTVPAWLIQ